MLLLGQEEGHLTCKEPVTIIPKRPPSVQVKEENQVGNQLTQFHMENGHRMYLLIYIYYHYHFMATVQDNLH